MNLILATNEFELRGQSFPGFPLLFDEQMHLVEPAHQFLVYHLLHRGRVESVKSWRTIGQHLYDFFGFLEARKIAWNKIDGLNDFSLLAAYRMWSVGIGNGSNTINQRLGAIARFYQFALGKRWIDSLPFSFEEVSRQAERSSGFRHGHSRVMSPDVMLRSRKELFRFLTPDQIRQLLKALVNGCGFWRAISRASLTAFAVNFRALTPASAMSWSIIRMM